MGYVLDYCPSIGTCFGIQLRIATFIISILGLAWGALYIYLFTPYGAAMLEDMGLPNTFCKPLRYFHGLFGVLLCAVHILLFFAAKYESDALCELYVWFFIVFIFILIIAAVSVACVAIVMGNISFALFFQLAVALTISVSLIFSMIVANFRMELP